MSIHDITILLGIYIATIGAGALVGYIIDKSRKARRSKRRVYNDWFIQNNC